MSEKKLALCLLVVGLVVVGIGEMVLPALLEDYATAIGLFTASFGGLGVCVSFLSPTD